MKTVTMITAGLLVAGSLLTASSSVFAAASSNVAWDRDTAALLKQGNAERGKELALTCAGCHGASGVAANPQWPNLAGQDIGTTYKQLVDYKDGTRASAIMKGLVTAFTNAQMADVAAHYAAMPLPAAKGTAASEPVLSSHGDGPRLIPACNACHGIDGKGNSRSWGMPVLAGQNADYLELTLGEYKSGVRTNDVYGVMRNIAKVLSADEIAALASWYQAQGD